MAEKGKKNKKEKISLIPENPFISTKDLLDMSDFTKSNSLFSDINKWNDQLKPITLPSGFLEDPFIPQNRRNLENEINQLKNELLENQEKSEKDGEKITELEEKLALKERTNHIVKRVCNEAREKLLTDPSFVEEFQNKKVCDTIVVSIDIRRSTELMLKARKPELYSDFITELSRRLGAIILENYGVFDKFTGDGILAFFPKFYSGKQAIKNALKAAYECHQVFFDHYNNSKSSFSVFIKDIGLGIGIDAGDVTLVNNQNELTVVGVPVVYSCRMSSAKAGETLLNIPAKEEVEHVFGNSAHLTETEIEIKNEGTALAFKSNFTINDIEIEKPKWLNKSA